MPNEPLLRQSSRTPGACSDEAYRILRAAEERRLIVNDRGRYEIVGDSARPGRKVREQLQRSGFLGWYGTRIVVLTPAGHSLLYHAERERGDA